MRFSGSIKAHANDDAETPLVVDYDYEDGRVEITNVGREHEPLAWSACVMGDAWRYWDYSNEVDMGAVEMRCAENAAERMQEKADRDAAQREDADDLQRELDRDRVSRTEA